ncbi:MAG: DMT family transporter, partial [Gemmatimonadales bacterium]
TALGSPLHATVVNFVVGTVLVLVAAGIAGLVGSRPPALATLGRTPGWMFTGGLIGGVYVLGMIVLAPKLGVATLMALVITGQLLAALVLDHYGWLGFPVQEVTSMRVIGAILLVLGVILVRRG